MCLDRSLRHYSWCSNIPLAVHIVIQNAFSSTILTYIYWRSAQRNSVSIVICTAGRWWLEEGIFLIQNALNA